MTRQNHFRWVQAKPLWINQFVFFRAKITTSNPKQNYFWVNSFYTVFLDPVLPFNRLFKARLRSLMKTQKDEKMFSNRSIVIRIRVWYKRRTPIAGNFCLLLPDILTKNIALIPNRVKTVHRNIAVYFTPFNVSVFFRLPVSWMHCSTDQGLLCMVLSHTALW